MKSNVIHKSVNCLGWLSLAIGAAEFLAPTKVHRMLGVPATPRRRKLVRAMGMREAIHGASLLAGKRLGIPVNAALWARVAGDVLDTGLLAGAGAKTKRAGRFAAVATTVLAIGAIDLLLSLNHRRH